ncbi:hypothetical protein Hamer_G006977, partial [Homarus americanus]
IETSPLNCPPLLPHPLPSSPDQLYWWYMSRHPAWATQVTCNTGERPLLLLPKPYIPVTSPLLPKHGPQTLSETPLQHLTHALHPPFWDTEKTPSLLPIWKIVPPPPLFNTKQRYSVQSTSRPNNNECKLEQYKTSTPQPYNNVHSMQISQRFKTTYNPGKVIKTQAVSPTRETWYQMRSKNCQINAGQNSDLCMPCTHPGLGPNSATTVHLLSDRSRFANISSSSAGQSHNSGQPEHECLPVTSPTPVTQYKTPMTQCKNSMSLPMAWCKNPTPMTECTRPTSQGETLAHQGPIGQSGVFKSNSTSPVMLSTGPINHCYSKAMPENQTNSPVMLSLVNQATPVSQSLPDGYPIPVSQHTQSITPRHLQHHFASQKILLKAPSAQDNTSLNSVLENRPGLQIQEDTCQNEFVNDTRESTKNLDIKESITSGNDFKVKCRRILNWHKKSEFKKLVAASVVKPEELSDTFSSSIMPGGDNIGRLGFPFSNTRNNIDVEKLHGKYIETGDWEISSVPNIKTENWEISDTTVIKTENWEVSDTPAIKNENWEVSDTSDIKIENWEVSDTSDIKIENWEVSDTSDIKIENWEVSDTSDIKLENWEVSDTSDINNENYKDTNKLVTVNKVAGGQLLNKAGTALSTNYDDCGDGILLDQKFLMTSLDSVMQECPIPSLPENVCATTEDRSGYAITTDKKTSPIIDDKARISSAIVLNHMTPMETHMTLEVVTAKSLLTEDDSLDSLSPDDSTETLILDIEEVHGHTQYKKLNLENNCVLETKKGMNVFIDGGGKAIEMKSDPENVAINECEVIFNKTDSKTYTEKNLHAHLEKSLAVHSEYSNLTIRKSSKGKKNARVRNLPGTIPKRLVTSRVNKEARDYDGNDRCYDIVVQEWFALSEIVERYEVSKKLRRNGSGGIWKKHINKSDTASGHILAQQHHMKMNRFMNR